MRTCAVVACVATFVVLIHCASADVRNVVKTVHQECQADSATHADEDLLKKFHDGEEFDKSVVGPHIVCMCKKLGLINEEGKVNKEKLKRGLARGITDETELREALDKCSEEKDSIQETALAVDKCLWDKVAKKFSEHHHH